MDIKDMMIEVSGVEDNGMPKASVVLLNEFWSQDEEFETVDELALDTPELQFFAGDGFVTLDLKFGSKHNIDLSLAYELLERFRVPENSIDSEGLKIPMTCVTVFPAEYEGQYYIACLNPIIYCLTAENPRADLTILRMMFYEDSCVLYENEDFEPDDELEDEE